MSIIAANDATLHIADDNGVFHHWDSITSLQLEIAAPFIATNHVTDAQWQRSAEDAGQRSLSILANGVAATLEADRLVEHSVTGATTLRASLRYTDGRIIDATMTVTEYRRTYPQDGLGNYRCRLRSVGDIVS